MFCITSIRHSFPEKAGFYIDRKNGYAGYTFLHFYNSVELLVNGELITTQPHACILYAPGTRQYFKSETPLLHDWFHFSLDMPLPEGMLCDTLYYPTSYTFVTAIVREMENEFFSDRPYQQEVISLKTHELLVKIARYSDSENTPAISHKVEKNLSKLRTYMFSHLGERWTVKKMASQLFLSTSHFHSLYRTLYGKSPMDDLIAARVYSAQLALTFSNEPIASIATRLGYNSLSHFVRQFSAVQGCPPGKYRKQYAGKHWMRPTNDGDMYAIDKSVIQRQ